jgi:tRNA (cytidine/uridine-2'-O-)-methyltransferase
MSPAAADRRPVGSQPSPERLLPDAGDDLTRRRPHELALRSQLPMAESPRFHVVLFQPEIPQNTGNIGRTCVATGCKLWLVRPCGFRLDDHHLRRAGLDYWQHLDWEAVDGWGELSQRLEEHRFWYFSRHAGQPFWQVAYEAGDVLVFGSETAGLPSGVCDLTGGNALRIPTTGVVRSLNLSNAVAVAVYEALRTVTRSEARER